MKILRSKKRKFRFRVFLRLPARLRPFAKTPRLSPPNIYGDCSEKKRPASSPSRSLSLPLARSLPPQRSHSDGRRRTSGLQAERTPDAARPALFLLVLLLSFLFLFYSEVSAPSA
ncbi:hypothetical protein PVAP13_6NG272755 [Panicum virgatum]|uniref:Transmembrane protein n=1 Tax=Panicum virgatum TaxID=38727 RepID=A0A8T0R2F2_PANVG|nr:hypothetical protein PVAP13_6NG272755 [Panicum virgatum]